MYQIVKWRDRNGQVIKPVVWSVKNATTGEVIFSSRSSLLAEDVRDRANGAA